jgi:hypothetical protein
MLDRLPALHDPHYCGLGLVVSISSYTFVSLLVLGFGFLELDLVDFNAVFGVGEGGVVGEGVADIDVATLGVLCQDTVLGAGEGLESPF